MDTLHKLHPYKGKLDNSIGVDVELALTFMTLNEVTVITCQRLAAFTTKCYFDTKQVANLRWPEARHLKGANGAV